MSLSVRLMAQDKFQGRTSKSSLLDNGSHKDPASFPGCLFYDETRSGSRHHPPHWKIQAPLPKSETPSQEPLDSPCASHELFLAERQEVEPSSDGGRTRRNSENEANQDRSGGVASKGCMSPRAGGRVIGK